MQDIRCRARLFRSAVIAILGLSLITVAPGVASAQDSPPRFEAGGSFTAMRVGPEVFGPGAEGDVNFGRHIAFDAAYSWSPTPTPQHVMTALFGVKAGTRMQRFGFFGKVRPGLISFGNSVREVTEIFGSGGVLPTANLRLARLNQKALDLGGVLEYYPARHWALRWDAGDLMVFGEQGVLFTAVGNVPPGFVFFPPAPGRTTHNFMFSTAVHYRF